MPNLSIWKFPFKILGKFAIEMPEGAQILHAGYDEKIDQPCLWALVDIDAPKRDFAFDLIGTGFKFEGYLGKQAAKHVATLQMPDGFVWHIFRL